MTMRKDDGRQLEIPGVESPVKITSTDDGRESKENFFDNVLPAENIPPQSTIEYLYSMFSSKTTKSEKELALLILLWWSINDEVPYESNYYQKSQALRHAVELKKYAAQKDADKDIQVSIDIETIAGQLADLAQNVIPDNPSEDFYKPWKYLMAECIKQNRLCPAIKYLQADKWYDVCNTPEYAAYYTKAQELLDKTALPQILEIILPDRVQEVTYIDLGLGDGEKALILLNKLLSIIRDSKRNLKVKFEAVDASLNILEQGLIRIFIDLYGKARNRNLLSGMNAFVRDNSDLTPIKWSNWQLQYLLRKILAKFISSGEEFLRENKLLNHLLAATLGIHTTNKGLLADLNTNEAYENPLTLVPRLIMFSRLSKPQHKPKKATSNSRTVITAFGNSPVGNNPIGESMELFTELLDTPELEKQQTTADHTPEESDYNANYLILGVHLRTEGKERILAGYETPIFKNFVKHAFSIPQFKIKMHKIDEHGNQTTELKDIDDAAELVTTYDNAPWTNNRQAVLIDPDQNHPHYYRVAHVLKFKHNIKITIDGKAEPIYKKAGEEMLLHYSYKFTLDEITQLLQQNGFRVVKHFLDNEEKPEQATQAKILIRKMTRQEREAFARGEVISTSSITHSQRSKSGTYSIPRQLRER